MNADRRPKSDEKSDRYDHLKQRSAVPGKGGISRIAASFSNTVGGLREGILTEAAIKQEVAIVTIAVPLSVFIADGIWVWVALMASLLLVLAVEFLNTAIERLCNHVHPDRHEGIRVTKDLASAGVFFALTLAGLVWSVALLSRLGIV
ncbi:MAG: diacylglycerol kinase [Hyphomicrobiaceae bacterium]|nr:diacylglycerol kinase [Hyphomicrobiaceae bacterium]